MRHHPSPTSLVPLMVALLLSLSGCSSNGPANPTAELIPSECSLPAGISVVSLALDGTQAGELPSSGTQGFSVAVEISAPVPPGQLAVICFAVRDVEVIAGAPLAAGFIGMTSQSGTTRTLDDAFFMTCDDGEVAGRAGTAATILGADALDRSSGERNTRIRVQHLEGIQTFAGITTGVQGTRSNRIRLRCP